MANKKHRRLLPEKTRKDILSGYAKKGLNKPDKEKAIEDLKKVAETLPLSKLSPVYNHNVMKVDSIKNLLMENPDLELAVEILVSSIVSPTDMITTNFIHSLSSSFLPFDTRTDCEKVLSDDFKDFYKVDEKLYDWVAKTYNPGAFVFICIGDKNDKTLRMMDAESDDTFKITDITKPKDVRYVDDLIVVTKDSSILNVANNMKTIPNMDAEEANLDKELKNIKNLLMLHKNGISENVDRPLVLEWPMESVIPVCLKNDPETHLRYILLLDSNGLPLEHKVLKEEDKEEPQLAQTIKKMRSTQVSTENVKKSKETAPTIDTSVLLEHTIDEKLKRITDEDNLSAFISDDDMSMVKKIMFNKAMRNESISVLVLDPENVAYLAYEYKENGVGKSPLEDLTIIGGIRAMLRYTTLSTLTQNATQFTKIKVKLDDDDKDLDVRIQEAYDFIYSSRADSVPVGLLRIEDISDWLKSTGVIIEFEHENLPSINVDVERLDKNKEVPDTELDEQLARIQYMKLHLSPEMVDTSKDVDYAESVKTSNVLFKRRLIRKHKRTNKFLTDVEKVIIDNDGVVRAKLKRIFERDIALIRKELKKNTVLSGIVESYDDAKLIELCLLEVKSEQSTRLPDMDSTEENVNSEMFDAFESSIDKILEQVINEDMFPEEFIGDGADSVEYIRAMMKSSIIRRWLSNNGYYKDTLEMFNTNGKDINIPLLEEYADYADNFNEGLRNFFKGIKKLKRKSGKMLEKFNSDEEEPDEDTTNNKQEDEGGAVNEQPEDVGEEETGDEQTKKPEESGYELPPEPQ